MRQSSARHASLFPEEVVSAFHRRIAELRGFGLIALVAVCLIALGTWSATDPNFSYATDGTVKNLMGRAGAAFSDFMMQVLGLGSLALLIPLGVWGWLVMTHRAPSRWRVRLLFWLGGVLLACGFAACFRAPTDWPLPTGLGGAIGDSLVFVPSLLLGSTANASRILMGLLFGMPMIFTLAIALGAGFRGEPVPREEDAESFDPETGEIREGLGFFSRVSAAFGSVFHFFYMVRTRLAGRRPPKVKRSLRERLAAFFTSEPELPLAKAGRREPTLVPGKGANAEPRPGRHAVRTRARARHQVERASSACRRHRPLDERGLRPRRRRPGRNAIGIELPNAKRETVYLREMLAGARFREDAAKLPLASARPSAASRSSPTSPHAAPADRRHHRLGQVGRRSTP
jgi:hypothetical protein